MILRPSIIGVKPATASGYHASAVHFDGSTWLLSSGLTGVVDSPLITYTGWLRIPSPANLTGVFADFDPVTNEAPNPALYETGEIVITLGNDTIAGYNWESVAGTFPFDTNWHSLLFAVDTNHASGQKIVLCYLDDVSVMLSPASDPNPAFNLALASKAVAVPDDTDDTPTPFIGDAADFWCAPGVFIDFTVTANRRKFVSATNKPVSLGADGSTPTGTAPTIFFSGNHVTFATNNGTGGAFTLTGALTDASTSPSD